MKQMINKTENLHTVEDKVNLILFALLMILAQSRGSRHKLLELAGHHLTLRGCNKLEGLVQDSLLHAAHTQYW